MGYRIKTVSELTGVPRNTLLAWERRHSVVSPSRRANGYREYSQADVDRLLAVKALVDSGLKVGEAISRIRDGREVVSTVDPVRGQGALDAVRTELTQALMAFDRPRAIAADAQLAMEPFRKRIHEVYMPIMEAIGTGWAAGQVSIAQEHFASGFVRERLMQVLRGLDHGPRGGTLTLCAGFPGDHHELPLLTVAIELAMRAHRVVWLGANVPSAALARVAHERQAAKVCVSAVHPQPNRELIEYATQLRRMLPDSTELVVGGAAVSSTPLPLIEGVQWAQSVSALQVA